MQEVEGMAASVDPPAGTRVTYSRQFRRCNKPDCTACRSGGVGHGPYWYAIWRQEGRKHSRYLGKELPPAASASAPAPPILQSAPAAYPALRVRTLGAFTVWRGAELIPASTWRQRMVGALFKCLLSAPHNRLHRDVLVEWLWPEAAPGRGAAMLRRTLSRLRQVLGQDAAGAGYLRMHGEMLVLEPAPAAQPAEDWLDTAAFERAATAALGGSNPRDCRRALALYCGEYLPDERYEAWAFVPREELHDRYLAVLLHLADLRERQGVLGEAAHCLNSVLAIDPCHEPAARALMRVEAAAGHHAAAVRAYQRVTAALARELDLQPATETEEQYQAVLAGRHATTRRHTNLPTLLTCFLGREEELAALSCLLGQAHDGAHRLGPRCRLLTLTGVGGVGKTRLAIELAHQLRSRHMDGVWLVELAALSSSCVAEPELIAQQVCTALDLPPQPGRPALETVQITLGPQEVFLILDNCEHLVPSCAAFAVTMLSACPGLQIMATSREALGVLGETLWPLAPLAVPDRHLNGQTWDRQPGQFAGVRLFLERAAAVRPGFALTAENTATIVELCRRLEGIPLALELAAARLAQHSVHELARRLDDRFRVLVSGNRAAAPRHQTLRAVLDWSYGLLVPEEQAVLRALTAFGAGGWTLDAAEQVCVGPLVEPEAVLDLHARLVSKSLVVLEDTLGADGGVRYRLLETVRQYAAEHLTASQDAGRVHRQHLGWCLSLAERLRAHARDTEYPAWLKAIEAEHDNMRAALGWAMEDGGDPAAGVQLAAALSDFWLARGHLREGRRWLDRALHLLETTAVCLPIEDRARVLDGAARLVHCLGDSARAIALQSEHLAIQRRLGNQATIAASSHNLGLFLFYHGEHERAAGLLEASLRFEREHDDRKGMATSLVNLGMLAFTQGDLRRAQALHEEGLAIAQALGDTYLLAAEYGHLGLLAYARGDHEVAVAHFGRKAILEWERQDLRNLADALDGVSVAGVRDDPMRAAVLFGAAHALREVLGTPLAPMYQSLHRAAIEGARTTLGHACFSERWRQGQALSLEAAVRLAVAFDKGADAGTLAGQQRRILK